MLEWKPMEVAAFLKTDAKASEYPRLDPSWTFGFPVGSCTGTLIVSDTGSCELQLHDASTSALVAQWQVSCSRIYVSEDGRHGKSLTDSECLSPVADRAQRVMAG